METIYSEYWNHARQCINERLWFTNIYAVVLAAILVLIGENVLDKFSSLLLASFGIILSLIGYMVVIAVSLGYDHYIGDITLILYYWDKMEFYRRPGKPITFRNVHRWFFEITIVLFSGFILHYLFQTFNVDSVWLIPTSILILAAVKAWYHCNWKEHSTECARFKKALQYDFDGKYREKWDEYFKDPRHGRITIGAREIRKEIIEDAVKRKIIPPYKECWICERLKVILFRKSREKKTDQGKHPGESNPT